MGCLFGGGCLFQIVSLRRGSNLKQGTYLKLGANLNICGISSKIENKFCILTPFCWWMLVNYKQPINTL